MRPPVHRLYRRIGFSSASSGIRAFKQATGMTMDAYREQYGNAAT